MFETQRRPSGRLARFSASLDNLDRAVAVVTDFLAGELPGARLFEAKLLTREALLNAVIHGSGRDPAKVVEIEASLSGSRLTLAVADQGPGFDWRARLDARIPEEAESGRGVAIMRLYADGVEFSDKGDRLTLVKDLDVPRAEGKRPGHGHGEPPMSEIRREGGRAVIRPGRDIVASAVEGLKTEIKDFLAVETGPVAIDLTGVDMVDSVGIGLLIATHNTLAKSGRGLALVGVGQDLAGLFRTMRLDKHFEMLA